MKLHPLMSAEMSQKNIGFGKVTVTETYVGLSQVTLMQTIY